MVTPKYFSESSLLFLGFPETHDIFRQMLIFLCLKRNVMDRKLTTNFLIFK